MVHSGVFTMLPAMSSVRMRSRVSAFSRVAEDRAKFEPIRDQSAEGLLRFYGSAQELVETRILGCFLKNDEFGLGNCHALGLEQQIGEILVATTPSKKGFDVAVDGFHHPEGYFGAAVVEDAVEVVQQRESEFLKGYQPLPAQLIDPTLQIAQHGSFIAVGPQPFQTFLQKVGFHHPSIQGEQLV